MICLSYSLDFLFNIFASIRVLNHATYHCGIRYTYKDLLWLWIKLCHGVVGCPVLIIDKDALVSSLVVESIPTAHGIGSGIGCRK